MFNKITAWLINRSMKTPYIHLKGYMMRYWLIPYNPFGIAIRVHHILRSDNERNFHDHPWPYINVILRGGLYRGAPDIR